MIVIDASMVGALAFADEPDMPEWLERRLLAEAVLVPAHWRLEVSNMLIMATRRGRLTEADRARTLQQLGRMGFDIDGETNARAWYETLVLCDRFGLTSYDAAYLELAVRRGAELATLDTALISAGRRSAVSVLSF